ncbi:MAG TPA: biotin transporter BioY [Terriglobia bacterium]|nr:biotin transporter BioY [Terriglobia bacterium]
MQTQLTATIRAGLQGRLLYQALLVVTGSLALAAAAHIKVPFWPVPMTMQSFVVMAVAASLGARLGCLTVLAYLVEGVVGLPVFTGGAGLAYLAGPTAGYLAGFLLAAAVIGYAADRGWTRGVIGCAAALMAGEIAIFTLGTTWLAYQIGLQPAIAGGLLPFLPGEAAKLALACAGLTAAGRLLRA